MFCAGIKSELINLPADTKEEELLALINKLNNDDNVDGVLVQLPVPDHITEKRVNIIACIFIIGFFLDSLNLFILAQL